MLSPVKKTKHNLYVCDRFNRLNDSDSIYSLYKNPSSEKIRIYALLDRERMEMLNYSYARICGSCHTFTYMYTFQSEKTGKYYLRRICKTSEEDIEVIQE